MDSYNRTRLLADSSQTDSTHSARNRARYTPDLLVVQTCEDSLTHKTLQRSSLCTLPPHKLPLPTGREAAKLLKKAEADRAAEAVELLATAAKHSVRMK